LATINWGLTPINFAMPYTLEFPHPRLQAFVASLSSLVNRKADEATTLQEGRALLQTLVSHDDWLPAEQARPDPERYQQHLLYVDPQDRFSVVSFVWGPGQLTPIHNHTVWGLVGMLRGLEGCQAYVQDEKGGYVAQGPSMTLKPGQVEAVSPHIGDVHQVWNGLPDRPSISIHVYGANIGKVRRSVFAPDGTAKEFVSGYSNPPKMWQAPAGMAVTQAQEVLAALHARREIALLDVREEDPYAQCHPLYAVNLPLSRLEADASTRIPRRSTQVVVYDDGEGLAQLAVQRLQTMGYTQVSLLHEGLQGWLHAGGEYFQDVNTPSKAFGEWVESIRHTPSLSAPEVKALIDAGTDMVVLDARRLDEYQTMNIPTGVSVPGAELVLRARAMAPNPETRIIVNCAGRTRSIIGTQSLVNAGIPNPVSALRNGTIGWTLAGQTLETGSDRRFKPHDPQQLQQAQVAARAVADRAGVQRIDRTQLAAWQADPLRTTYVCDVRVPQEYAQGHWPGSLSTQGGQLVQETDHTAAVRGARFVLIDPLGVRADMSASWLAQMGWEVAVLADVSEDDLTEMGPERRQRPTPDVSWTSAEALKEWLSTGDTWVIDLGTAAQFIKGHIPGAWGMLRSTLWADVQQALKLRGVPPQRCVLTCADGVASAYAQADVQEAFRQLGLAPRVHVLSKGNDGWKQAFNDLQTGTEGLLAQRIDRYRRPYEGTSNAQAAMQAYLDWEFGLVEQLQRDGTHHFAVI
jgi:predicted metal-dependent enzyme (double-stranded beta helix superfamily)/rhodanese-related sulfurtransferase